MATFKLLFSYEDYVNIVKHTLYKTKKVYEDHRVYSNNKETQKIDYLIKKMYNPKNDQGTLEPFNSSKKP